MPVQWAMTKAIAKHTAARRVRDVKFDSCRVIQSPSVSFGGLHKPPPEVVQNAFDEFHLIIAEIPFGFFLQHGDGVDGVFGQGQVFCLFICLGVRDFPQVKTRELKLTSGSGGDSCSFFSWPLGISFPFSSSPGCPSCTGPSSFNSPLSSKERRSLITNPFSSCSVISFTPPILGQDQQD